jgi:acetyl/propionyl-CoA carboxylase alpha subunit
MGRITLKDGTAPAAPASGEVTIYHDSSDAKLYAKGADGIARLLDVSAAIEDAIVNGVTTKAPSQNVVFDQLALKQDASGTAAAAKAAAVSDSITNGVTDVAPSQNAVFDALALKRNTSDAINLASDVTGQLPIANQVSQRTLTPKMGQLHALTRR